MRSSTPLVIGPRETLPEAVAEALIGYIAANGLRPGDKLPSERELVEMVGVSRLPLREGLCILRGLGIVESRHGKGVYVKPMDMGAIFGMLSPLLRTQADISASDIVQTRLHFEPVVSGLAALHRGEEDVAALESCLRQMGLCVYDKRAFIEHDLCFHERLARATGNPIFQVFMSALADLLREVQFMYPDNPDYRHVSVTFHASILSAVKAGDREGARLAMLRHINDVEERI